MGYYDFKRTKQKHHVIIPSIPDKCMAKMRNLNIIMFETNFMVWLREAFQRKPPPPTVSSLGYFFSRCFLNYWRCLVRCETDFVPFLLTFDQNNTKQRERRTGQNLTKFDKLKARGLILMVK